MRPDGYFEIRESGNVYGPTNWLASLVLCSAVGLVHIGANSVVSREDAVALVDGVLSTIAWKPSFYAGSTQ